MTEYSLSFSDPLDKLRVLDIPGEMVPDLETTTELGLGYATATFSLLAPDGSPYWRQSVAFWMVDLLDWCVVRVHSLDGVDWTGRVWDFRVQDAANEEDAPEDACKLSFSCRGLLYSELTRGYPLVREGFTEEDAEPRLSTFVRAIIKQQPWVELLNGRDTTEIQETTVSLGPVTANPQDTALDVLTNYLRVGENPTHNGGLGEEMTLLWYGERVILRALCDCPGDSWPRWKILFAGSGGSYVKNGDDAASSVSVTYTKSGNRGTGTLSTYQNQDALARMRGWTRDLMITGSEIDLRAAIRLRASTLALKSLQGGFEGPISFSDREIGQRPLRFLGGVPNANGIREPFWRPRAGDVVAIGGLNATPSLRTDTFGPRAIIQSTRTRWSEELTEIILDRRAFSPRQAELAARWTKQQRLLAPGNPKYVRGAFKQDDGDEVTTQASDGVHTQITTIGENGVMTVEIPVNGYYAVHAEARLDVGNFGNGPLYFGYEMDAEGWSVTSNPDRVVQSFAPNSGDYVLNYRRDRWISAGTHTFKLWFRHAVGATVDVLYPSFDVKG